MAGPEALLVNSQDALIERFSFIRAIRCLEQLCQIVQAGRDSRIVRAKAPLVNGQSAPINRLSFLQPGRFMEQRSQIVKAGSDIGMVQTKARFFKSQRTPYQRLGFREMSKVSKRAEYLVCQIYTLIGPAMQPVPCQGHQGHKLPTVFLSHPAFPEELGSGLDICQELLLP
jgi:hypothetical protein